MPGSGTGTNVQPAATGSKRIVPGVKLYWCPVQGRIGGGWYGRRAIGLTYYSQRLSDSDRPMLRAQRIRRKLGSDDGTDEPEKPNGMHWATYNRLLDRADELDDLGWMSALGGLLLSAG